VLDSCRKDCRCVTRIVVCQENFRRLSRVVSVSVGTLGSMSKLGSHNMAIVDKYCWKIIKFKS